MVFLISFLFFFILGCFFRSSFFLPTILYKYADHVPIPWSRIRDSFGILHLGTAKGFFKPNYGCSLLKLFLPITNILIPYTHPAQVIIEDRSTFASVSRILGRYAK